MKRRLVAGGFLLAATLGAGAARAQSGSLHMQPVGPGGKTVVNHSWIYNEPEKPRQIKKQDIVTVVVQFDASVLSEGEVERRKRSNYDAILADWVRLEGLSLKPAAQASGDPRVKTTLTSQNTQESDLQTRDKIQFTIAATVVDVRPNGNLVLEAHQVFENNEEVWEQKLSGIVRPEDVLPNNTVLSKNVSELSVKKHEIGTVRDGYRRTWFTRLIDDFWPF
jgi:flagellar L-ring protein precursor FlgH